MQRRLERCYQVTLVVLMGLLVWSVWSQAQDAAGAGAGAAAGAVSFTAETYRAKENDGRAEVLLRRTGGTNQEVSVMFEARGGSARAGSDFEPLELHVVIPAGVRTQAVEVVLLDNADRDTDRWVDLVLKAPVTGASLGTPALARLEIVDNDQPATPWLSLGLDRLEFMRTPLIGIPAWQYLVSLLYILLAFAAARVVDWVISTRLRRWSRRADGKVNDRMLHLVRGPIRLVLFVILLHFGLEVFDWPVWLEGFFSKALKLLVALSLTYVAVKGVDVLVGLWRDRRPAQQDRVLDEQLLPVLQKGFKLFLVVVAALVTAQNLEFNITGLLASLSIGGLALGLAAQDTVANLFGAVSIFADKPFRIGDRILIDGNDGVVEAIGLRSTRVRNLDGFLITVPNKTMGNATITNITRRPSIRTIMTIGLTYNTSAERVRRAAELLREVCRGHPGTVDVWISFNQFADFSLNITVIHWCRSTDYKSYLEAMHELHLSIKERFDQEGLDFAFPTRTIYMKHDPEPDGAEAPEAP